MVIALLFACADVRDVPAVSPLTERSRVGDPGRIEWVNIPWPTSNRVVDWGKSVAVGDFDGNGIPELVVQGVNTEIFSGGPYYLATESTMRRYDLSTGVPVALQNIPLSGFGNVWDDRREGAAMTAGDVNGDGYDDLVVLDVQGNFYRLLLRLGSATGVGSVVTGISEVGTEPTAPWEYRLFTVDNLYGDGRVGFAWSGRGVVGGYRFGTYSLFSRTVQPRSVDLGLDGALEVRAEPSLDLDGDGRDEAVLSVSSLVPGGPVGSGAGSPVQSDARVDRTSLGWVPPNPWHGLPEWLADTDRTQPLSEHGPTQILGFADVSLDGHPDLILSPDGQDRAVHVHLGLPGGGVAEDALLLPLEASDSPLVGVRYYPRRALETPRLLLEPADFDGDGLLDILVLTDSARLYRWSAAPGGPAAVPTEVFDLDVNQRTTNAVVADLNLDGAADLVVGLNRLPTHESNQSVRVVWGGPGPACPGGGARVVAFDDADGDGHASTSHATWWCTPPATSQPTPGDDCDDDDARVYPGSTEAIGGVDADCDGWVSCLIDEDDDGAGHLPVSAPGFTCDAGGRRLQSPTRHDDCDDQDPRIRPSATDTPGRGDENCDGVGSCFTDADLDGVGADPVAVVVGVAMPCPPEYPSVDLGTDCAPTDPAWHTVQDWYGDGDGDGAYTYAVDDCVPDAGLVSALPGGVADCDDADAAYHPGAEETVIGEDLDCDGDVLCWWDADDDGWGGTWAVESTPTCNEAGFSNQTGDCNDDSYRQYPGRSRYDVPGDIRLDHDCDGLVLCFVDDDLDGSGGYVVGESASCQDVGFDDQDQDCDDADANVSPHVAEDPATPWDDNCNGFTEMSLAFWTNAQPVPGAPVVSYPFAVVDAPPAETVYLFHSARRVRDAWCPPQLGGACVDLARPTLWDTLQTDHTGAASANVRFVEYPGRPAARTFVQAVMLSGDMSPPLSGYRPR